MSPNIARSCLRFAALVLFLAAFSSVSIAQDSRPVNLITIKSAITPVSARMITNAIEKSVQDSAQALIIELDTPGGLDESMRQIVRDILGARIPVVVYVAPGGSRAASAGVFITLAAHVAAMAPGTNIGAAHPVALGGQIDSTMLAKVENDAAAYVKSLAKKRGRNEVWAEEAVRKSVSITEYEALEKKVIDLVARDLRDLLEQIDGKTITLEDGKKVKLATREAQVERIEISWRDRILEVITNPNIAYILYTLGMLGLFFELSNPGAIVPGVIGGICLILAFFAFQSLPINYAGVLLMALALILFALEIKVISHGVLTIGGIVSMLLGSLLLIDSAEPYMKVSFGLILVAVGATALFFIIAVGLGLKAQRRKPTTGDVGLLGQTAVVKTKLDPEGTVFVEGELWKAVSDKPAQPGDKVRIVGLENLTLKVTKI
ncbi:MAG: nodulation protein NfeD [candidate division Zixibacteria bacterium]|nr:nodulation protein NfeD [candidate division Zixibacteria bacterium]